MIPPQIKRLFTSSPTFGLLLLFVTCIFLYALLPSASTSEALVSGAGSVTGKLRYGYPPPNPTQAEPGVGPIDEPRPLNLPPLSTRYTPHFPERALPPAFDTPALRPLARKLHAFLGRRGFEHVDFQVENDVACPRELSDRLVNADQVNGDGQFWDEMTSETIAEKRAGVVKWLEARVGLGEEVLGGVKSGEGRGIVLTGGNQDTTLRMIHVLKMLKGLGTELPVEVFHYSDELHDQRQRQEIESLGAKLVQIRGVEKQAGAWKNWQIKGLALVQSSFREVLYLDSDNTPLRDPSHLFTAPLYLSHGRAVFWPDISKDHPRNAIWRIVGEPCTLKSWTLESGQILVDKAGNNGLNLAALLIAAGMQGERDFWFKMCGGDKDTFRWGWEMLGIEYAESPRWMGMVGLENGWEGGRFCGHSILQYDLVIPEGFTKEPPLFVHSNLLKIFLGRDLTAGRLFTHIKRIRHDATHFPALNHVHAHTYDGSRGTCLDIDLHDTAGGLSESLQDALHVEYLTLGEEEGNVFDGFEAAWLENGGRVGGWNN